MEPFNQVATAQQREEARQFWSRVGEWGQSVNHPMAQDVANFIRDARQAAQVRAHKVQVSR